MLHEHVAAKCSGDKIMLSTRIAGLNLCKICPCNMSREVQQVELRATCCRGKFCTNFMLHEWKSARPHTRGCVTATTVPEIRPVNFFTSVWQLYYMSLLHVPATRPCNMSCQCVLNAILSPLHFVATCSCNMSPRVGPPLKQSCTVANNSHQFLSIYSNLL